MPSDDLSHTITCDQCDSTHLVTDLEFPEPDTDGNTQYSWLVARCPRCANDLTVSPAAMAAALDIGLD